MDARSPPADAPKRSWRRALQLVAIVVVAVALWLAMRKVDVSALGRAMRGASLPLLLLVAALNFVNIGWKALYWRAMVAPVADVSFGAMLRATIVSLTASTLFPARAGEALRVAWLHRDHGVPLRFGASIVAFEKVGDVLALLLLAAPIPWLVPSAPPWVRTSTRTLALVALAAVVLAIVAWSSARARAVLRFPDVPHPHRLAVRGFAAIALSWATDALEVVLVLVALGSPASLGSAALVLLAVNLAISVPVAPGHAGTLELGAIAALDALRVDHEHALAFALVYHALQIIPTVLVGLWLGRSAVSSRRSLE